MPWAINGTISTDQLPGGIPITDEQYRLALQGILEGKLVAVDNGFEIKEPEDHVEPGEDPDDGPAPLAAIMKYPFWKAVHDAFGLTKDEVIAAIDASSMTSDEKYLAKLGIETAVAYQRDDPNVVLLLNLMGYSEQEADDFWRWATPTI
jgi:hypothetical protein